MNVGQVSWGSPPNKRINLTRPTVSVVTSDRSPRRSCAVRWADVTATRQEQRRGGNMKRCIGGITLVAACVTVLLIMSTTAMAAKARRRTAVAMTTSRVMLISEFMSMTPMRTSA